MSSPEIKSSPHLPEIVRRAGGRAVPRERVPRQVRVAQEGEMWLKPGARRLRFTAVESFAAESVAFAWDARFPIVGPLSLRVIDDYADGDGKLEVRLLGLPLKRQRGPETVVGEALPYLAELPWVPRALAHNPELDWRELDGHRAEVATGVRRERLMVEVEFNADAEVVATASTMRRRRVGKEPCRAVKGSARSGRFPRSPCSV